MSMINEFVEKLIEQLETQPTEQFVGIYGNHELVSTVIECCVECVNQLAEEFGGDINVGSKDAELIEKIKFGIEASNINDDYTTGLRNGMRYCLALIDGKEPKFESCKQGWIPVSERLPDENKYYDYYESVIVTLDNGRVVDGCYRNMDKEWWVDAVDGEHYSVNATGHVIAWQPLPEPYKGE